MYSEITLNFAILYFCMSCYNYIARDNLDFTKKEVYNMSKKPYKQFHQGKGFSKTRYTSKPFQWKPFSFIDSYNAETGKFRSRRKYGEDGWAYKDMDVADEKHPRDHIHDIQYGKRSKIRRDPNKQEKAEFEKAKKKRRFI